MKDNISLKIIARVKTGYRSKFGIPRQSGLVPEAKGVIVFEPGYRNDTALRGLEDFSHLWLLWKFSESVTEDWSPTVRPPKLGGNARVGVFATRSPFRPNPIGLSSVKLEGIEYGTPEGAVIHISGADLLDNTPVYDIKPYIAYTDSHPDATGGFSDAVKNRRLKVDFGEVNTSFLDDQTKKELEDILSQDPRPGYQQDKERVYRFEYSCFSIAFRADEDKINVVSIEKLSF